jgi:hypothetical protein
MTSATFPSRPLAWIGALPGSALALVIANLVPLFGVLFLGWNLASILVLYWVESGVVGLLNIPKILLARGPITVGRGDARLTLPFTLSGEAGLIARVALSLFFAIHYGIFWAVHGVFVFLLPTLMNTTPTFLGSPPSTPVAPGPEGGALAGAAALLLASHAISFFVNYVGRREYLGVSPVQQMFAPYSRVVVMHVTILFGAFLAFLIGSPVWTIAVMVLAKTIIDLRLHAREHATSTSSPQGSAVAD